MKFHIVKFTTIFIFFFTQFAFAKGICTSDNKDNPTKFTNATCDIDIFPSEGTEGRISDGGNCDQSMSPEKAWNGQASYNSVESKRLCDAANGYLNVYTNHPVFSSHTCTIECKL